jgi:hypothetical protein
VNPNAADIPLPSDPCEVSSFLGMPIEGGFGVVAGPLHLDPGPVAIRNEAVAAYGSFGPFPNRRLSTLAGALPSPGDVM